MKRSSRIVFFLLLAFSVIALDQIVKAWARGELRPGESWSGGPIPGIFELTLTYNQGVAFGALEGKAFLAIPIALAISIGCALSATRSRSRLKIIGLALLASGAIGNVIDRLLDSRGVTDMFLLRLANLTGGRLSDFPVFNVADAAITAAVGILAYVWLREAKEEKPETKVAALKSE